jgi:uncharacterized protein (DUF362 family)
MKPITRREFVKIAGTSLTAVAAQQLLSACGIKPTATELPTETQQPQATESLTEASATEAAAEESAQNSTSTPAQTAYLAAVRGEKIEEMVRQGVKALGGMERFMKPGADVIIKPNICVAYNTYEYASTTNPWVVGALVKLCIESGAKRVRVMDFPFGGTPDQAYKNSGIQEQVEAAGGSMEIMSGLKYVKKVIDGAVSLKQVEVYGDVLTTDLLINVPIAKNHSMARLTLGLKNLMGTILDREAIHPSFEKNLSDLATLVRPQLTVIDGIRTLMANGPTGGSLDDVKLQNTLVFSPDIVAADSYATRLFGKTADYLPYLGAAERRGLGKADLSGLKIEEINV